MIEPIPLVEPEPVASPAAPNIPSEGVSPEQVGRDANGKSIRLKGIQRKNYKQYFCSLGSKQISPQVRRESKKNLKYRKKMVKHRVNGDALLRSSSLSEAISFLCMAIAMICPQLKTL